MRLPVMGWTGCWRVMNGQENLVLGELGPGTGEVTVWLDETQWG